MMEQSRDPGKERAAYEAAIRSNPLFASLVQAKVDAEVALLRYNLLCKGLPNRQSCGSCNKSGSTWAQALRMVDGQEVIYSSSVVCPACLGGDLNSFLSEYGLQSPVELASDAYSNRR